MISETQIKDLESMDSQRIQRMPFIERTIIGCLISGQADTHHAMKMIHEDFFSDYMARLCFQAIKGMPDSKTDCIAPSMELEQSIGRKAATKIIGIGDSIGLSFLSALNVDQFIESARERRKSEILDDLRKHRTMEEALHILAEREKEWGKTTQDDCLGLKFDAEQFRENLRQIRKRGTAGFKTTDFITATTGGFREKDLSIIAARPGGGKTLFAMQLLRDAYNRNPELKCAFINLEMDRDQMIQRMIQCFNQLTFKELRMMSIQDISDLAECILHSGRMVITPTWHVQIDELIRRMTRLFNEGIRLFAIDYVQLIKTKTNHGNRDDLRITECVQALKEFKDRHPCHICLLAQLNRSSDKERNPSLSALKGSSIIEEAASWVGVLKSSDEDLGSKDRRFSDGKFMMAKNRFGMRFQVDIEFDYWTMTATKIDADEKFERPTEG